MPKDRSRRYHDRVARQYDAMYDDPYWHFHDELTWRTIKPHLPRDAQASCLDLGAGTGKWGLRLLKGGFPTTFVDHSGAMIEQIRQKLGDGPRAKKATLVVGDIVGMPELPSDQFSLTLAMGDPLSICSDAQSAANEMFRVCRPGGVSIVSADNKLAALDHFAQAGNLDALEEFIATSRTNWLTADQREQFELTMFTPASLRRVFEKAGFEILALIGKPILPIRLNQRLLASPEAQRRILRLEEELQRDPTSCARAAHLQITVRKPI
ncbi:MAG TPA: methyltransferase domain-containing protein, partial [Tepidisphaeraceae bacterium]|nr:methyltransferase domain-containing protein [Tepidisphaeraceae bacterium]